MPPHPNEQCFELEGEKYIPLEKCNHCTAYLPEDDLHVYKGLLLCEDCRDYQMECEKENAIDEEGIPLGI